jgi:hypothetical protein
MYEPFYFISYDETMLFQMDDKNKACILSAWKADGPSLSIEYTHMTGKIVC